VADCRTKAGMAVPRTRMVTGSPAKVYIVSFPVGRLLRLRDRYGVGLRPSYGWAVGSSSRSTRLRPKLCATCRYIDVTKFG